ncbi:MAG: RrF2 family transcriptional regulator [Gemmatimonadetes bacterium]|nr:RrF2 family transcriptional regulator [Gemmatimonadota bacterium]
MISKTAEYALRSVIYLAQHEAEGAVPATDVARALGVPANYLAKILHALARVGLVVSQRGPGGGFQLARPARAVSLADVIEPFDDVAGRRECLLGRAHCSDRTACAVHDRWKEVHGRVSRFFQGTTVAELLEVGTPSETRVSS